eukprot:319658-Prorocentrum_minimum.AAC.1
MADDMNKTKEKEKVWGDRRAHIPVPTPSLLCPRCPARAVSKACLPRVSRSLVNDNTLRAPYMPTSPSVPCPLRGRGSFIARCA